MSRIILSPKHGVNPTLAACFFCGGDTEDVALLGRLPGDAEAPRKVVLDHEPCSKCRDLMRQGIMLMEIHDGQAKTDDPGRTGRMVVLREEAVRRMVTSDQLLQDLLARRFGFMERMIWNRIGLSS